MTGMAHTVTVTDDHIHVIFSYDGEPLAEASIGIETQAMPHKQPSERQLVFEAGPIGPREDHDGGEAWLLSRLDS